MKVGKKYLVSLKEEFVAPDGNMYRALWGTVKSFGRWPQCEIGDSIFNKVSITHVIECDICNLSKCKISCISHGDALINDYYSLIWDADQ